MPLGTLDRTPPPFFRQGQSALSKLIFFTALAVFLMVADTRLQWVTTARAAMATALAPVQRALLVPVQMIEGGSDYFVGLTRALAAEDAARKQLAEQAERVAAADRLAAENASLRTLLGLKPSLAVRSQAAEVMYEATDPFSRKLFINRGAAQGVLPSSPVITEGGVIGQVTRVYPLSSEVTLLTDRDAAIPLLNTRTQQRAAAFGGVGGGTAMELRFVAANADIREGDLLHTSGVDGVYPAALPVARVATVERLAEGGFARVTLAPLASVDGVRHVLVLEPLGAQLPPRPVVEPASAPPRPAGRVKR
ncbi:MAG: rod shape-determining protein MreC [Aquincola sp.]|nr:rod shape-determining protein MreC [Aquincola sp.]MDH4288142.1 rod shape-determining protein MreC [Aquincola sp.]MDH5329019.1 rod shape-determining protein MreC [Aquincola sp.]